MKLTTRWQSDKLLSAWQRKTAGMRPHRLPLLAALAAILALPGCSNEVADDGGAAGPAAERAIASAPTTETAAEATGARPLGTVPGTVTLPPEARVAVTAAFPGAVARVFVIEGQRVSRGQPLAVVRAAEPLRIGGNLARAGSEVRLAEAQAARLGQLAKEGIIAQARADEANARLEQARVTAAENRRLASLAGSGPDGTMTLRAPIAGRVAHVGVETGGPVDLMSAPFVIEATDSYRLDLALPERLAHAVRPGMAIEVRLPLATGKTLPVTGRILSVAPSIDPESRSVIAKATIGAAPGLVPGQNVMAVIIGSTDQQGVAVPSRAVTRIGDTPHVFVRRGNGFVPRPVVVVAEAGDRTVLSEGLEAGEIVAISGIAELKAAAE
ncbi:efflux RND transporter periplasmic adaptor subunit [Hoeflea sp.]|uniref:efflux RND transporter periplasmic adaptor subunit n=1 Tax=Hoeflea sp. TaxID=1940281 RepID=UPI0019871EF8|nr:efflux RND transporter periplasmic adaptor subunit [Hoeflea sp.]MBC7284562.1 efflux RND transporter periplasmic adaptor subunit [Hoeflea sp.]